MTDDCVAKDSPRPDQLPVVPATSQRIDPHPQLLVGGVDEPLLVDHHPDVARPVAHHHHLHRVEADDVAPSNLAVLPSCRLAVLPSSESSSFSASGFSRSSSSASRLDSSPSRPLDSTRAASRSASSTISAISPSGS